MNKMHNNNTYKHYKMLLRSLTEDISNNFWNTISNSNVSTTSAFFNYKKNFRRNVNPLELKYIKEFYLHELLTLNHFLTDEIQSDIKKYIQNHEIILTCYTQDWDLEFNLLNLHGDTILLFEDVKLKKLEINNFMPETRLLASPIYISGDIRESITIRNTKADILICRDINTSEANFTSLNTSQSSLEYFELSSSEVKTFNLDTCFNYINITNNDFKKGTCKTSVPHWDANYNNNSNIKDFTLMEFNNDRARKVDNNINIINNEIIKFTINNSETRTVQQNLNISKLRYKKMYRKFFFPIFAFNKRTQIDLRSTNFLSDFHIQDSFINFDNTKNIKFEGGFYVENTLVGNLTRDFPHALMSPNDVTFYNVAVTNTRFLDHKEIYSEALYRGLKNHCIKINYHYGEMVFNSMELKAFTHKAKLYDKIAGKTSEFLNDLGRSNNKPLFYLFILFIISIYLNYSFNLLGNSPNSFRKGALNNTIYEYVYNDDNMKRIHIEFLFMKFNFVEKDLYNSISMSINNIVPFMRLAETSKVVTIKSWKGYIINSTLSFFSIIALYLLVTGTKKRFKHD